MSTKEENVDKTEALKAMRRAEQGSSRFKKFDSMRGLVLLWGSRSQVFGKKPV